MKAWETMMTLAEPEIWDSHPDPQHEGYDDFRRTVAKYETFSRAERLEMGRRFLRGFRAIEQGTTLLQRTTGLAQASVNRAVHEPDRR
jgi:hypothetical protein